MNYLYEHEDGTLYVHIDPDDDSNLDCEFGDRWMMKNTGDSDDGPTEEELLEGNTEDAEQREREAILRALILKVTKQVFVELLSNVVNSITDKDNENENI